MDESKALLILKLRQIGVSDPEILDCIESIDRSHFVSKSFLDRFMEDIALPIDCGQTVSQPSLVGFMTQQLEIPRRSKVLEMALDPVTKRQYLQDCHQESIQSRDIKSW
jgi:protein-L-isoaspartate(D-aspartate) O-methyltransferase